jgi:alkyl sulfatase BDS1-like metallo-beta-lactamase superfamily hydrolase
MVALEPELLLPGHGLPIVGRDRVRQALTEGAELLESIVEQTLAMMNAGVRLDDIAHSVQPPAYLLERPYLQPIYDEPEFVVRNIWRQYGGWYDGNPAHLKPAPGAALAGELAALAGGATKLAERARELAAAGDLPLAGHLAELAAQAEPDDKGVHAVRAEVFSARAREEASTMSKGIYSWAAHESETIAFNTDAENGDQG